MKKHTKAFDAAAPDLKASVCGWPAPSFDVPLVDFERIENGAFEKWVNENYLRINRFCDVEPMSSLSMSDNVELPYIRAAKDRQKLFEASYEEIMKSFVDTRKLAYTAMVGSGDISTELLKMTYKNFYSVFDKIAVFLQAYLNLPIRVHQADFASIWTDRKGRLREDFMANPQNLSLLALYNVKLDVYGSNSVDQSFFGIHTAKRAAAGGQMRTTGAFGGGLTRKQQSNVKLLRENYILVMKTRQKIWPK